MATEIERKFLINGSFEKLEKNASLIIQGYLSVDVNRTVRIRIENEQGFITIKGISSKSGLSRYEWEKEIPLAEAKELLELCLYSIIEKKRYKIKCGNHTFEVDEFFGDNLGLRIAEIELSSEDESFEKPIWLGEEVSGKPEFYNAMLCQKPFKNWK